MRECSEFLIVPPHGDQFDSPTYLEQLRTVLAEAFPGWTFTVTASAERRCAEDFIIAPSTEVHDATIARIAEVMIPYANGMKRLN